MKAKEASAECVVAHAQVGVEHEYPTTAMRHDITTEAPTLALCLEPAAGGY